MPFGDQQRMQPGGGQPLLAARPLRRLRQEGLDARADRVPYRPRSRLSVLPLRPSLPHVFPHCQSRDLERFGHRPLRAALHQHLVANDTAKPAIVWAAGRDWGVLLRGVFRPQVRVDLRSPAFPSAFEHVRVMKQPIEQGGDRGGAAEQLAPVIDRSTYNRYSATRPSGPPFSYCRSHSCCCWPNPSDA